MTKQELLQVATQKKFQIIHSFNVLNLPIIGIDKHKNSIHWFFVHDSENVYFDHTYNVNTGKVKKSANHMINIIWSFQKHLS